MKRRRLRVTKVTFFLFQGRADLLAKANVARKEIVEGFEDQFRALERLSERFQIVDGPRLKRDERTQPRNMSIYSVSLRAGEAKPAVFFRQQLE